jgi:mono/diheme cytochrome c family protein
MNTLNARSTRRRLASAMTLTLIAVAGAARSAEAADGKALYTARCGMCHQTIGMAVAILSRRPGDASKGLLEDRADLSAAFVRTVVRTGIMNMPRIARGEVSDPELAQIANYLARGKP